MEDKSLIKQYSKPIPSSEKWVNITDDTEVRFYSWLKYSSKLELWSVVARVESFGSGLQYKKIYTSNDQKKALRKFKNWKEKYYDNSPTEMTKEWLSERNFVQN